MTTQTQDYPVKLTVGDASGVAREWRFTDMARAEECANSMLGREWGEHREISVATFYLWNGTYYEFHSEMEW